MGYAVSVIDPDPASPAGRAADHHEQRAYADPDAWSAIASRCVAVTTEFENVPAPVLDGLARRMRVSPSAHAVRVCQHRAREKAHFVDAGVPCAAFASIEADEQATTVDASLLPGILKTASLGYDGKGQRRVRTAAELMAAWRELGSVPCVLEALVPIRVEISVIVARNVRGDCVSLPVQQNLHRDGILAVTQVPAPDVDPDVQRAAVALAHRLAQSLGYVGVLCVEFFVLDDGTLLANEMAPRPHNSGHYSIDACDVSQFELQVRTLADLPLVTPRLHSAAVMLNLLGDLWWAGGQAREPAWHEVLALPGVHLHLYGKAEPRPGRKMGHLTVTAPTFEQARSMARQAAACLGLPTF